MPQLPEEDRQAIWRGYMRYLSQKQEPTSNMNKADLKAAVDAIDDWIEDSQVSFNASLPNPFKNSATQAQKTLLFCIVALMRVDPAFVRAIFGRID